MQLQAQKWAGAVVAVVERCFGRFVGAFDDHEHALVCQPPWPVVQVAQGEE